MDFSEMERDPSLWALTAFRLNKGGDLIFDAHLSDLAAFINGKEPSSSDNLEMSGVATMLYGLAIENLLKASIIKHVKEPGACSHHNQITLSEMLADTFTFNDLEKDLFGRFTAFVKWAGKYKVPLKKEELYNVKQACIISGNSLPIPLTENEREKIYKPLYEKLISPILTNK